MVGGIWFLSGEDDNPFRQEGQLVAWGKSAGLVAGVLALTFLPAGSALALVGCFVGIMTLFHCNFGEALMIFTVNLVFGFAINWLLLQMLG